MKKVWKKTAVTVTAAAAALTLYGCSGSSDTAELNEEALNKIKKIVDEKLPLNLAIIKFCLHSNASDVIVPVWDLLEVDNEQRFNIPGEVNDTNWTYRVSNMSLVEKAFKLFNKLKSED